MWKLANGYIYAYSIVPDGNFLSAFRRHKMQIAE